jgi:hypothetical protein
VRNAGVDLLVLDEVKQQFQHQPTTLFNAQHLFLSLLALVIQNMKHGNSIIF